MTVTPFHSRLGNPVEGEGLHMADCWVWGGSATRDPEGRYHLFASRWPKQFPFHKGYKVASEIIRASADRPEGPFAFEDVILTDRGEHWWDGRMTHNPSVLRIGDWWYLFYIGSTYPGSCPTPDQLRRGEPGDTARGSARRTRIGMAMARHPAGPWIRPDAPCLEPRPEAWDAVVVTNPSPCLAPDGRLLLYYRSNTPSGCRLGAAAASRPGEAFLRLRDGPILADDPDCALEDPFVWWNGRCYEMVAKDLTGKITGSVGDGMHAVSADGVTWEFADPPVAWRKTLTWADGAVRRMGCLERPQLLLDRHHQPTHLYCAMGDGTGGFDHASKTWLQAIRLR